MEQLISIDNGEMSVEYRDALTTHQRIMANAEIAASSLVEMCKDMKKMRDLKLYTEFGYSSFEEYTEKMVGIKSRQAYNYISTYEKLGSTVLQSNAELGITKLALIADMNPTKRMELLDGGEIEGMSVSEIKEIVKKNKEQGEQISLLTEKLEAAEKPDDEIQKLQERIAELQSEIENKDKAADDSSNYEQDWCAAQEEITNLKEHIKELEEAKEEKAEIASSSIPKISDEEKEKLRSEIKRDIQAAEKEKAEEEIQKAVKKAAAEAAKKAKAEAEQEIELLKKMVEESDGVQRELQKALELSDSKSAEAKVYLNAMQDNYNLFITTICEMPEEQQNKFRSACLKLLGILKENCEG